jgi:subtilisin family serine protease
MAGIAFGCKLMAVKVLNNKGVGPFDSVANGIVYATTAGARVINMSLGSSSSSSLLETAVQFALDHDVVVVAAAGNAGNGASVEFPGALPGVIAVGSTNCGSNVSSTCSDSLSSFSCTGHQLDLVAPGLQVRSLTSDGTGVTTIYSDLSGTSFASPMVAGVAGLIRSIAPTLTYTQVTQYLDYFSDDVGPGGFDSSFGFGRLNAFASLDAVRSHTAVPADRASPGKTFPAPNPFNPLTGTVAFYLPAAFGNQGLEINVIDLSGATIKKLDESCIGADGLCHWDGKNSDGNYVASGFYLYRAKTSNGGITGKLTVLK